MYFQLAAKVANAVDILVEAQQQGEADYSEEESPVILLDQMRRVVIKHDDHCRESMPLMNTIGEVNNNGRSKGIKS